MGTKNNPGAYDCVASAHPDEAMFALLGRDRIAGSLVRLWALAREQMGEDPPKVAEAHDCAALMDAWCRSCGKTPADVLDLLPFEVLKDAALRRQAIVLLQMRDDVPGEKVQIAHAPLTPTLVLTGKQLRIAELLAEDDDTEVCVGFGSPDAKSGPGMYAWVQGYPEEGAVPLFDESVPLNEQPDLLDTGPAAAACTEGTASKEKTP